MSDELHNNRTDFANEIDAQLRSVKNSGERRTLAGLLRQLTHLPLDHARAAVETSATIATVSMRASAEFLRAAPDVARVLEPAELRAWGELGRRLAMADIESGVSFFVAGIGDFAKVPSLAQPFVFQVCARQMTMAATTAAETFHRAQSLAEAIPAPE